MSGHFWQQLRLQAGGKIQGKAHRLGVEQPAAARPGLHYPKSSSRGTAEKDRQSCANTVTSARTQAQPCTACWCSMQMSRRPAAAPARGSERVRTSAHLLTHARCWQIGCLARQVQTLQHWTSRSRCCQLWRPAGGLAQRPASAAGACAGPAGAGARCGWACSSSSSTCFSL